MQVILENQIQVAFAKSEMIPAIVQDARSGVILMQGFMNSEALKATLRHCSQKT